MSGTISPTLSVLMDAAAAASEAGDVGRAEPLFRQIVAINPRDADAWHMLAMIAVRAGRSAEAIDFAVRAHALQRRNHLYLNTLGVAYGEAGQFEQALRSFKRALKERPTHAESHYNLGKLHTKLGQNDEAEHSYRRALQLDPGMAGVANNLGVLYSRLGRHQDALSFLADAQARLPNDEAIAVNRSIATLATAGPEAAIRELSEFVARHPEAAAAHAALGRRLLAQGRLEEGWREYAWRRGASAGARPDVVGKRVLLLPDQGLGDHLFFLRFVVPLRMLAAHVAFACPAKLEPLLRGNSAIDDLCEEGVDRANYDLVWPLGDLPLLLGEKGTHPPLALSVEPARATAWRERLSTLGAPPYLAVTWRAGSRREDQAEFAARGEDPLHKEIPLQLLASSVRAWPGTVLIVQRLPMQGEPEGFSKTLGRSAHDMSAVNDDLTEMLALLSVMDEYVGVSNTNMHLRAGIGKSARVLVPFPPEFRWMDAGAASSWFPEFTTYRQAPPGVLGPALTGLINDLRL